MSLWYLYSVEFFNFVVVIAFIFFGVGPNSPNFHYLCAEKACKPFSRLIISSESDCWLTIAIPDVKSDSSLCDLCPMKHCNCVLLNFY